MAMSKISCFRMLHKKYIPNFLIPWPGGIIHAIVAWFDVEGLRHNGSSSAFCGIPNYNTL